MSPGKGSEEARCSIAVPFSGEIRKILEPHLEQRSFRRGYLLWSEGDRDGMLVHIKSGRVKIYRLLPNGKAVTLYIFQPGTLFGFMPFLDDLPYPAYAQALEDCEVEVMYRSRLKEIVRKEPEVALFLLRHLSKRLRDAFSTIERLSSRGTVPKVASALSALVQEGKPKGVPIVIDLSVPSGEFASSLGITPESFSRSISRLASKGIIKRLRKNRFQILDLEKLRNAAEKMAW